ncbi:MAG: U32 family peptidase [Clostridiales bacterium]|nr:MAG: U32 family peptidase [Clostridiales bacterium]
MNVNLAPHASTQMTVTNTEGVKICEKWDIRALFWRANFRLTILKT